MTREEKASFILANIDRRVCDDELSEALDMAIKALEQDPCEDCVKIEKAYELGYEDCRADVLEIIDKYRSKSEE